MQLKEARHTMENTDQNTIQEDYHSSRPQSEDKSPHSYGPFLLLDI